MKRLLFALLLILSCAMTGLSQSFSGPVNYIVRGEQTVQNDVLVISSACSLVIITGTDVIAYTAVDWVSLGDNMFQFTLDDMYYVLDTDKGRLVLYGMEDETTADSYRQ